MLRDIVLSQMRELQEKLAEAYVPRDIVAHVGNDDLVRVVLGPRRAGKSFLAMRLLQGFGSFGYVNFDDERLVKLEDYDSLIVAINAVYHSPKYLLLDEIQNVPSWELLVNRLQRQGYRLTLTGSNAHLLSSELGTHLTGRHLPIVLFPFSFQEFVSASRAELTSPEKAELLRTFSDLGGYPEPLLKGIARRDYLSTLFRSILYKDIVVRHGVRSPQGIEDLARFLLANCGQRYTWSSLSGLLEGRSINTVQNYVRYLEEAFLVFSVKRFSYKLKEQLKSARKIYAIDNGMATATSHNFSRNIGAMYENIVATVLHKEEMEGSAELYYWQGAGQVEVDFVVRKDCNVSQLIQVCVDPTSQKAWARESRALVTAGSELDCEDLLLLTDATEGERDASWYGHAGRIRMVPLWKWALSRKAS